MKDDLTLCAEVFLKEQTKLYDEPVAQDIEEAKEFLEDCFAQVFDNIKEVREYLREWTLMKLRTKNLQKNLKCSLFRMADSLWWKADAYKYCMCR